MRMAAIAGQARERLGHEGRTQAMLFRNRLDHVLEERMAISRHQCRVIFPVHLELAVRILVIVLIGLPAQ